MRPDPETPDKSARTSRGPRGEAGSCLWTWLFLLFSLLLVAGQLGFQLQLACLIRFAGPVELRPCRLRPALGFAAPEKPPRPDPCTRSGGNRRVVPWFRRTAHPPRPACRLSCER